MNTPIPEIKSDLLDGIEEIANFIGLEVRRTKYLLKTGRLPAGHLGKRWLGSKARLSAHLEKFALRGRPFDALLG